MERFMVFTGRNLKLYLRDKGAIFFSLLSMLVVIGLSVFFLGDMNVEGITDLLAGFPGRDAAQDAENAGRLVLLWTCAGILSINAVTVTLSAYAVMIRDRVSGKLSSIYTAPIGRGTIAAGYVAAAWISSVIICTITLFIMEGFCAIKGIHMFDPAVHLQLLGMIAVNSFAFSAIMYLAALMAKTSAAWSGIGTVVGTLVGFLGAIYVPIGALSGSIVSILKCTPVLYGAAMFRSVMMKEMLDVTFAGLPEEVAQEYCKVMGIHLEVAGHTVKIAEELSLLAVFGMIFLICGIVTLRFSSKTDR